MPCMSNVMFARTERHRLVGLLLRVRALVYVGLGLPIIAFVNPPIPWMVAGVALLALAAATPFATRSRTRTFGMRSSITIDLAVSYLLWVVVPEATALSLLAAAWTVVIAVFLLPRAVARTFASVAVVLELSKLAVVVVAPSFLDPFTAGVGWVIVGRSVILAAAYAMASMLDRYLSKLYIATETGSDRYERLMSDAPTAFVIIAGNAVRFANAAAERLLEAEPGSIVGLNPMDYIDATHKTSVSEEVRTALEQLDPVVIPALPMTTAKGRPLTITVTMAATDYRGDLALQVMFTDISAQRQVETELRETRLNYRTFFERIPVALYRSRPSGEIIQANRALIDILGANSETEVIGRNAKTFYVDKADREHLSEMLSADRLVVGFEARLRRLDGRVIWVRDTSRLISTDFGDVYEGSIVDVTSRRDIEDELWSRAMQQEAVASIGQTALEVDDISEVMRTVAETVARVLRTDGAAIIDRTSSGFRYVGRNAWFTMDPTETSVLADRAHMTAAPVVLRTEGEIRFAAPALADAGVQSSVAVMVPATGMEFGTLAVVSESERVFTSDDLNFLHSVANVLAAALDRAAANAKLEELLKSKDAFVASVSHELRTPLTVVTGMAYELRERWGDLTKEELAEFTNLLVDQSRDMSDLIEDLLVAARANIGNVTVRKEPVDLKTQVSGVLTSFAASARMPIQASLEDAVVDADPIRVRQILRNLVTNAIRYGGDEIEVVMSSTAGARVVEVIDNGPGIPVEDRERVFAAYERAHHAAGQPGSVGLGLTVSRTLAQLMGGSLTYRWDGRSTFRLELPRSTDRSSRTDRDPEVAGEAADARRLEAIGSRRLGVVD